MSIIDQKNKKNTISEQFFKVHSILAKKHPLKPKNLNSLNFSASFDTHLDPRGIILSGDIIAFTFCFKRAFLGFSTIYGYC